jgi:hypothetical protein
MRGWLSAIHGQRDVRRQVTYYERLVGLFRFFADWCSARPPLTFPAIDGFGGTLTVFLRLNKVLDPKIVDNAAV